MTKDVLIRPASTPEDMADVRDLCWDYRNFMMTFSDEVRMGVSMGYPEAEYASLLDSLELKHARPKGLILLAEVDGQSVGCGMYHPLSDEDAEIKRVFVRDTARGLGAGRDLSQALLDSARQDGYRRALLDTSRQFIPARRLYEKLGFKPRGPYSDLPPEFEELLVFYEFSL